MSSMGKEGRGSASCTYVARALDSFLPKFLLQHYDIAVTHLYDEERIPLSAAYRVFKSFEDNAAQK